MEELYSFSRLTTFHTCKYSYYLTYVLKLKRENNIYGFLGGKVHEILESLQREEISNYEAIDKFNNNFECGEILGMDFPTESSKEKYKMAITNYLENYKRVDVDEYYIEEYFEIPIGGVKMRGYIDLYTISDGVIDVYDYKTSSKFSKKDLETKKLQLIIYAIALQKKYPNLKIRNLYFDMCKYTLSKRGALVDRLNTSDTKEKGLLKIEFNKENIKQAEDFVRNTYEEIKEAERNKAWDKIETSFFCTNICSNYNFCTGAETLFD